MKKNILAFKYAQEFLGLSLEDMKKIQNDPEKIRVYWKLGMFLIDMQAEKELNTTKK